MTRNWVVLVTAVFCSYIYEGGGQYIRVGFQREETATSSYGRVRGSYSDVRKAIRTTSLSPTVDYSYWQKNEIHRQNGQHVSARIRTPLDQGRNIFKQWLMNLTDFNYDRYQPPKRREKKAVVITVSMMIIRVHSLSDSSMDFGIEMYYRESWNDHRLRFHPSDYDEINELNLPIVSVNHVWKPDTYFKNAISAEVDSENSVTHKAFFHLSHNGDIQYSRKISLKADCPMDLTMYPFDIQACRLKLGSYSSPSQEVAYRWVDQKGQDIEFKERIDLAEFYADGYKTSSRTVNYTTGSFDSLELCLTFKRRAGFCIMQVFFPATAVVMSSWVALWLAEDTTFSDVLAVILAIIFLAYAYNSVMPRVSYVKLLDLYMCSCFLFVFLSLAKLVIIKYFCHKWAKQNNRSYDFFLDQLLGMSAGTNGLDVEQQSNGQSASAGSRQSSISLPKEEKKKAAKRTSKYKKRSSTRKGSVSKLNGSCHIPTDRVSRQEESNLSITKSNATVIDEEANCHRPICPRAEEENFKNEETEATHVHECDETKLDCSPRAPGGPANHILNFSPLARLFPFAGSSLAHSEGGKRVTFFGMEAFAAWFDQRKKKSGAARCMRFLRYFHVFTQLALPLAFGAFFIFLLLIYPNVPRSNYC